MELHKANGTVLGSINGTEKANIMEWDRLCRFQFFFVLFFGVGRELGMFLTINVKAEIKIKDVK